MKALLLSPLPPPNGGIASWTKRIMNSKIPGKWEYININTCMIGNRDPFKNTKVSIKDEIKRSKEIWKKEKKILKTDKEVAIVHTCIPCTKNGMIREIISARIAKKYKTKFILHCRCTVPNVVNTKFKLFLFKRLSKLCSGIIVLNSKSLKFVNDNTKAYCEVIPNFVSQNEISEFKNRRRIKKIDNVIYTGGVTEEKGCKTIIEVATIKKDVTFHLIGNVSREIELMDIPNNVILYGNKDKDFIINQLKKSDCFIFLSKFWGEGFSNSLLEGMACGLPCIVTDWAANDDMIGSDGGIVIKLSNVESVINAIEYLNNNIILANRMGENNINKVKYKYDSKTVIKEYVNFYERILK